MSWIRDTRSWFTWLMRPVPPYSHGPWASLPSTALPSPALCPRVGMHTIGVYHLHPPGPPSSESSTPWRDLFLPLPQTALTGMAPFPSAPVPVQLLQLLSGLPHPGPEVASGWPLSVGRTVKCAGQVLSSTMVSRGRSSEREEGAGGVRGGRDPSPGQAKDGRGQKTYRPGGFNAHPPGPQFLLPCCFSHFSVARWHLRPQP